ncbi:lasso peptide biosynthesis B2 protein [Microtetraspora malaysiensis]|uniref:lasso peptide biosynthesis B2 protein n=1 Tax=Microtetraspora malaysiensis TaxID=161358 RepID=UPI003D8C91B5
MTRLPQYVTAPAHVAAADLGPVLVLVDYRSGAVHSLLAPAATWWRRMADTGQVTTDHPRLAEQLIAAGLLLPTARPTPWPMPVTAPSVPPSWGSSEHPAGLTPPVKSPTVAAATAAAALSVVLTVKSGGPAQRAMRRVMTLVRLSSACTRRQASVEQAEHAVHAVRYAARALPGRVACLEESAAVVVLLAARRLSVTWCHGIAGDPVRLHAWVQTGCGLPVAEPESTSAYTALTMIAGGYRHDRSC